MISIIISILALTVSISTFVYTIYKDNKESIILRSLKYDCKSNTKNGYIISGTYIATNNSHKNVSIIKVRTYHAGSPIHCEINNTLPINLSAGESCSISIEASSNTSIAPRYFKLIITSAKNKRYDTHSACY